MAVWDKQLLRWFDFNWHLSCQTAMKPFQESWRWWPTDIHAVAILESDLCHEPHALTALSGLCHRNSEVQVNSCRQYIYTRATSSWSHLGGIIGSEKCHTDLHDSIHLAELCWANGVALHRPDIECSKLATCLMAWLASQSDFSCDLLDLSVAWF